MSTLTIRMFIIFYMHMHPGFLLWLWIAGTEFALAGVKVGRKVWEGVLASYSVNLRID